MGTKDLGAGRVELGDGELSVQESPGSVGSLWVGPFPAVSQGEPPSREDSQLRPEAHLGASQDSPEDPTPLSALLNPSPTCSISSPASLQLLSTFALSTFYRLVKMLIRHLPPA